MDFPLWSSVLASHAGKLTAELPAAEYLLEGTFFLEAQRVTIIHPVQPALVAPSVLCRPSAR